MLLIPMPDLFGLVTGEIVVAESERGGLTEGDEFEFAVGPARAAADVKPAYREWLERSLPPGSWTGVVVAVHPAQAFDAATGWSRHLLDGVPHGDLVVLRVYGDDGPVLSDVAFEARVRSLEGALRT